MDQLKLVSAWEASRLKAAKIVVTLEGLMLQVLLTNRAFMKFSRV